MTPLLLDYVQIFNNFFYKHIVHFDFLPEYANASKYLLDMFSGKEKYIF